MLRQFKSRDGGSSLRCVFRSATAGCPDRQVLEAMSFCMGEEFGQTYSDPRVYDVDALVHMVKTGRLITCAAIREDGDPVAVISVKECPPFQGVGDLSMHVVRQPYRGFGVGTPLVQFIMDLPETKALSSVISHSATYHSISQHESYRVGLRPCGALYSFHINALLQHSFQKVGAKQSFLIAAKAEKKRHAGLIFPPPEHRDFILDVYRSLGVDCTVGEAPLPPSGPTVLRLQEDALHQLLVGKLDRCGPDLAQLAEGYLNLRESGSPLRTATLFLNLQDPAAPFGYQLLTGLGFRFSGLHPLCGEGEYLILHHPLEVQVPFPEFRVDDKYLPVFDYLRDHFNDHC